MSVIQRVGISVFVTVVTGTVLLAVCRAQDTMSDVDLAQRQESAVWDAEAAKMAKINEMSSGQRLGTAVAVDEGLDKVEGNLLADLNSPDQNVASTAAFFIGRYRFSDAAPSLSKHIKVYFTADIIGPKPLESFWTQHPAQQALIDIGLPAVPCVLNNLSTSADPEVRFLSLQALHSILYQDKTMTLLYLQNAEKNEKSADKLSKLRSAEDVVRQDKVDDLPD